MYCARSSHWTAHILVCIVIFQTYNYIHHSMPKIWFQWIFIIPPYAGKILKKMKRKRSVVEFTGLTGAIGWVIIVISRVLVAFFLFVFPLIYILNWNPRNNDFVTYFFLFIIIGHLQVYININVEFCLW